MCQPVSSEGYVASVSHEAFENKMQYEPDIRDTDKRKATYKTSFFIPSHVWKSDFRGCPRIRIRLYSTNQEITKNHLSIVMFSSVVTCLFPPTSEDVFAPKMGTSWSYSFPSKWRSVESLTPTSVMEIIPHFSRPNGSFMATVNKCTSSMQNTFSAFVWKSDNVTWILTFQAHVQQQFGAGHQNICRLLHL